MVRLQDGIVYRDGQCIVLKRDNGFRSIIVDLGEVVYVSEGERVGHGRHIFRNQNVWMDSSGKVYILAGAQLSCSNGRFWSGIQSPDDADILVKADVS